MCHTHHMQQHNQGHKGMMSNEMWLYHAGEYLRKYLLDNA